jgi:hypothetical protein
LDLQRALQNRKSKQEKLGNTVKRKRKVWWVNKRIEVAAESGAMLNEQVCSPPRGQMLDEYALGTRRKCSLTSGDFVAMVRGASTTSVSKLDGNSVEDLVGSEACSGLCYH